MAALAPRCRCLGWSPPMREQLIEAVRAPAARERAEDVGEVLKRRHAVLGAGARQAIQPRRAPGGIVRAGEEVVLAAQGDVA